MAKGKRAMALFEVIQSSKTSRRSISDVLSTPKWWFKRKASAPQAPPRAELETTALATADVEMTAPAPPTPGVDLKLDPGRQRITFHITYTSALVSLFAVLVIVGLAYVIGSKMRSGPSKASAETSTEQLRQGPARGGVLNVRPGGGQKTTPRVEPDEAVTPEPPSPQRTTTTAASTQPTQRIIGLNYVVMQGYPPEEKGMAVEARELLVKQGIACTIEQDLPGLNRNWFIVVGLQGFERIGYNQDYESYERKVRAANDKFPKNAKFKKLEPMPYKWKG
jgi:hypothetical protein